MAEVKNSDAVATNECEKSELTQDENLIQDGNLMQDIELNADASELQTKLEETHKLAEERLDQLMRCRADLDNAIKRSAKEKEDNVKYASEKLVCKLLCVVDSLDQAAKHDEGARCSTSASRYTER